jgi:hypothetical protein
VLDLRHVRSVFERRIHYNRWCWSHTHRWQGGPRCDSTTTGRSQEQASSLRCQFLQDGDLPFTDVLSEGIVAQALAAIDVVWLDRIYSPLVTLRVFLGQILSADYSCGAAVARLITYRLSREQRLCSAMTGAYCQARKRLPEQLF